LCLLCCALELSVFRKLILSFCVFFCFNIDALCVRVRRRCALEFPVAAREGPIEASTPL
jgi:hypothetical protein